MVGGKTTITNFNVLTLGMLSGILGVLLVPTTALGGEIEQHSITAVRGDSALVRAHSPSGDSEYRCSLKSGECDRFEGGESSFLPKINGTVPSEMSGQGSYAVVQQVIGSGAGSRVFYSFYNTRRNAPVFAGLVSVAGPVAKTAFSPDENTYAIIHGGNEVTLYDIDKRKSRALTLDQTELPFFSVSEHGTYVSTYNYVTETHKIWDTRTGDRIETPGAPSLIAFNEDESEAAYLVLRNGFRNLAAIHLGDKNDGADVASGDFLVEDYTYVHNVLYYLANKNRPLEWSLYNADTGNRIAEDVSYNVYLTRYGDRFVYGKIDEKNTDLYVFDGKEHTRLDAAPVSKRVDGLKREVETYGGRTAALVEPEKIKRGDLYIWLHGGPRRQTSLGYHPYLSYAVYDELLENIAAAGNYVVKLDYTGSWGYGDAFMDALTGNVGTIEIKDVENTIKEFKKDHNVHNVYLIGNSYGGYMAVRALNALTNEIDGVISINGAADWYGLVSTIPSSPFKDLFGGVPSLTTLDTYLAASAFTNTADIDNQKMLIIYGSEDKTVPTAQSKQYVEFMEANDKNVTAVELPGAEHTITRRENLTEMCKAIRDVFDIDKLRCGA